MINGGFGESHVNGFLSSLNIPTITQSTLKSREREITPHLHKMAEDSCNKHLREEISMYVAYHFHVDIIVWCVCIYIYLLIKKVVKHY